MKNYLLLTTLLLTITISGQISAFKEKFNLPEEVKETSGLLFLNGKIITHNDSGDGPKLYEIDSISGNLTRTISIVNATNVDWEDITQDETHIYIADIGNNNGNRTDLKIYSVLKSDYLRSNSVSAEIISFSYENQSDFTSQPNAHNFDAEAIVFYNSFFLIFTKNWADLKTNVYKIQATVGHHSAIKISTAHAEGLITGATYDKENDSFFLCGYNTTLVPFLIYIDHNRAPGDDLFSSGFLKISLADQLEQGSQIEGITNLNRGGHHYLSREFFSVNIGENEFIFSQKLYQFYDKSNPLLSLHKNNFTDYFWLEPNPVANELNIKSTKDFVSLLIVNSLGEEVFKQVSSKKTIDVSKLAPGIYYLKIQLDAQKNFVKTFIKG